MIIGSISVFYLLNRSENIPTEAEMREAFRCDRITTEVLETDIYCQNYEIYITHIKYAKENPEILTRKFNCGWLTTDYAETDKYCLDQDLLIKDVISGEFAKYL